MARKSNFSEFKPKIFQEFEKGLFPKDLLKVFPEIPPANLYRWHSEYLGKNSESPAGEASPTDTPPTPVTIVSARSNVLKLVPRAEDDDDLTDFQLAVKVLREIVTDRHQSPTVRVQAANGLFRAIELERMIKTSPSREVNFKEIDFSTLSDRELQILAAQV